MDTSDTKDELASYSNNADPPPAPAAYFTVQPQSQFQSEPIIVKNATVVIAQPSSATIVEVPDHLRLALFTCCFCYLPYGLAAVFMAIQSRKALSRGDVTTAQAYSRTARWLALAAICIGIPLIILAITLRLIKLSSLNPTARD